MLSNRFAVFLPSTLRSGFTQTSMRQTPLLANPSPSRPLQSVGGVFQAALKGLQSGTLAGGSRSRQLPLVVWTPARMISRLMMSGSAQCVTWLNDLRSRERELSEACVKQSLQLDTLQTSLFTLRKMDPINELCGGSGSSSLIDEWFEELLCIEKMRHDGLRRLAFLQQEHENIRLTLLAFERIKQEAGVPEAVLQGPVLHSGGLQSP